jgi:hypothetical protein
MMLMRHMIRTFAAGMAVLAASQTARADLVHQWTFNGDARDQVGTAHGALSNGASLTGDRLLLGGGQMLSAPIDNNIFEKTLVSWVSLNNLDAGIGGSALSMGHTGAKFDGIVYAEINPRTWMAGSDGFSRTQFPQSYGTPETTTEPGEVMMAIVYQADRTVSVYRDGSLYGSYVANNPIPTFDAGLDRALIGPRHLGTAVLDAYVNEARVYNSALSASAISDLFNTGPSLVANPPPPPPPGPALLHQWTFNGSSADVVGNAHGLLQSGAAIEGDRLAINNGQMLSLPIDENITAKTLVSWVSLNNLDAGIGGSALSLGSTPAKFDGIVYAEINPRTWMAGSNGFARTQFPQTYGTPETTTEPGEVMMAIVYAEDGNITLYRDGQLYGSYQASGVETYQGAIDRALIGPRHLGTAKIDGYVNEARIYKGAMNASQILDLFNNGPSLDAAPPVPTAPPATLMHQWTFEDGTANDNVGTADGTLFGGAQIVDGRLSLDGVDDYMKSAPIGQNIYEKTLIAWVSLNNLTQQSGSALTLENPTGGDTFDGIVFGERVAGQWMNGSNNFFRSVPNNGGAAESVTEPGEVMMAIVYGIDNSITIYRDGELYAVGDQGDLQVYPGGVADVLLGVRHSDIAGGTGSVGGNDQFLAGWINEARVYRGALTPDAIRSIYEAGAVPEPSTYVLIVLGTAGLAWQARRRKSV